MTFHHVPCGECYYCRKQTPAQCPLYKKTGVTAGFEPSGGGFAEYIRVIDFVVANRGVVRIPDGVPFEQAAFIEPLNTVLKGVKLLNLAADDTVLVIGQGPIGLMHAALARRTGARVLTSDLFPERHAIAARFGLSDPSMPAPKMWSSASCRHRRPRCRCRRSRRRRQRPHQDRHGCRPSRREGHALRPNPARRSHHRSRGRLRGREDPARFILILVPDSRRGHRLVLDGYRNGFDLTQLISHRFPLEHAVEAIEIASHPQADSMKIMIEPVPGAGAD